MIYKCGQDGRFKGCCHPNTNHKNVKRYISNGGAYALKNSIFELCEYQMTKYGIKWFRVNGFGILKPVKTNCRKK